MKGILLGLCLLLAPLASQSAPLRADVIVFLNPPVSDQPLARALRKPDQRQAIAMDDSQGLLRAGIRMLPEADFGLLPQWNAMKRNASFERLLKLAFIYSAPNSRGGPAIKLYQPGGDGGGLSGWLRLTAGKEGGLQADLEYQQMTAEGPQIHRLIEHRHLMKDGSTQYLDGGRIGLLVKLSKVSSETVAP